MRGKDLVNTKIESFFFQIVNQKVELNHQVIQVGSKNHSFTSSCLPPNFNSMPLKISSSMDLSSSDSILD